MEILMDQDAEGHPAEESTGSHENTAQNIQKRHEIVHNHNQLQICNTSEIFRQCAAEGDLCYILKTGNLLLFIKRVYFPGVEIPERFPDRSRGKQRRF